MARPTSLVGLLLLLNAAAVGDRMIFGALAPVVQPALRLTDVQLALVQGPAFGFAYAAALPFAGRLVDAIGGRRTLVWSVLIWTLGMAVSAFADGLGGLVAGRAITGIGQAALTPAALTLILTTVPPGRAGRTIGLFTGAGTIGRGASFAMGGALLALVGSGRWIEPWSAVLLILAVGNLLVLGLGRGLMPPHEQAPGHRDVYSALWRWLCRSPGPIAAMVVAALCSVIVAQALAAWVVMILVRGSGVTPAAAALTIGAIGMAASPLGHFLGGLAADRDRMIARSQAGASLLCIPAIVAFVGMPGLAMTYAALAATMLVAGAAATIGLIRIQQAIPMEMRGTANGVFMVLVALTGISGGPVLVSLVAAPAGSIGRALALVVVATSAIGALAAMLARDDVARHAR